MSVLGLLVTGPEEALQMFNVDVCMILNAIDRRKQTVRFSCLDDDLPFAIECAKKHDVTLQQIVTIGRTNSKRQKLGGGTSLTVSDCVERYDVLHEATHKMKWIAGGGGA